MDVRTLAMILGITSIVQVIVFSLQAAINKTYRGVGWWLLWSVSAAGGFVFILLRTIPAIHKVSIVSQNSLLVVGVIFLYIGIMRFLDKREKRGMLVAIFAVFFLFMIYFTYVKDNIAIRTLAICAALASVSFLSAWDLYAGKLPSVKASANFISVFFLGHGCYFIFRAVMVLVGTDVHDMFSPSLFNVSAYLDAIIVSIIWTGGLIIMVNQRSSAEMAEAIKHFKLIFNTSPDAAVITRLENGEILDVNNGFTVLTGFSRIEAIGKSSIEAKIWKNPADRQRIVAELRDKGFSENFEAEFLRKDGRSLFGLMSAKVIVLRGLPHIISVTRDISERKRDEERVKALLQEKEILLKEVHHRIKNNMSALMGILTLQSVTMKNPEAIAALMEIKGRMHSMGILYDKLYRSDNVSEMSIKDYIPPLVDEIVSIFPNQAELRVEKRIEDFKIGVTVISPLGIIVNEVVTNALKYAFLGRKEGVIAISASKKGNRARLVIQDDGIGMPEAEKLEHSSGLGLQLVGMLVSQIGGSVSIERGRGTKYILDFDI